ncbi:MAG: NAD(P)/FAD-dependent oxidoreductase [Microbacteriaceae bacterium]|nr:NAD(P)/FAD-dependent oxidoreductase [Microbacteriaceae bacterium]
MHEPTAHTPVVVIGAGQAGLSVAYFLRRLGLDPGNEFVVLDRGPAAGGAWQHRWRSLRIGTAHRIVDLPGMEELGISFDTADRQAPAKEVVADYYARYEQHFGLQVVRPADVSVVENNGAELLTTFADEDGEELTVGSEIIVNATGTWGAPFVPWYPGRDDFAGRQLHTQDFVAAEEFAGRRVVVVGGGTSAMGFMLELEPFAAELTWVSRRPIDWVDDTHDGNLEGRVEAVAKQDEAARAGLALPSIVSGTGIPRARRVQQGIDRGLLVAHPMFTAIERDGVRWAPGVREDGVEFLPADAILWATGFRPELRHLAPLRLREQAGGVVVAQGTSWRDPRVFFAGYGPQASTIGANRAGRFVARQVVASLSRINAARRA